MIALTHTLRASMASLLMLALCSMPLRAQVQNILGTASGTFSSRLVGCIEPSSNGTNSGNLTLTLNHQVDTSFAGVGSGNDDFGPFSLTFSGSVSGSAVSISMDLTAASGERSQVSGSGTLSPGGIDLQFSGSDISGDTCSILDGVAHLSFVGDTFVPSESPSVVGTIVDDVFTALRTNSTILGARLRNVHRGKLGLAQIDGQGVMMSGSLSGASAGGGWNVPIGVWASYVRTDSKNDFVSTAFDSKRNTVFVGIDIAPWENSVLGLAVGFEDGSSTTRFNGGKQDSTGFTVAPYFGWFISETFSFDLSGGVTELSIEQTRTSGTGAVVESDTEALRIFAAGNLNVTHQFGPLLLTGTGGLLWASQTVDAFRENNGIVVGETSADVGQFRIGGEVAYAAGAFEPYFGAIYSYDLTRTRINYAAGVATPKNDNDDVQLGLGVRYFGDNDLSASLEYSKLLGRTNYDEDVFSANVRWKF